MVDGEHVENDKWSLRFGRVDMVKGRQAKDLRLNQEFQNPDRIVQIVGKRRFDRICPIL